MNKIITVVVILLSLIVVSLVKAEERFYKSKDINNAGRKVIIDPTKQDFKDFIGNFETLKLPFYLKNFEDYKKVKSEYFKILKPNIITENQKYPGYIEYSEFCNIGRIKTKNNITILYGYTNLDMEFTYDYFIATFSEEGKLLEKRVFAYAHCFEVADVLNAHITEDKKIRRVSECRSSHLSYTLCSSTKHSDWQINDDGTITALGQKLIFDINRDNEIKRRNKNKKGNIFTDSLDRKMIINPTKDDFAEFVSKFETLKLPYLLEEKTVKALRKNEKIDFKNLRIIWPDIIDSGDEILYERNFYRVGRLESNNYITLVYIKAYKGSNRSYICYVATFTKDGKLIAKEEIANLISNYRRGDIYTTALFEKESIIYTLFTKATKRYTQSLEIENDGIIAKSKLLYVDFKRSKEEVDIDLLFKKLFKESKEQEKEFKDFVKKFEFIKLPFHTKELTRNKIKSFKRIESKHFKIIHSGTTKQIDLLLAKYDFYNVGKLKTKDCVTLVYIQYPKIERYEKAYFYVTTFSNDGKLISKEVIAEIYVNKVFLKTRLEHYTDTVIKGDDIHNNIITYKIIHKTGRMSKIFNNYILHIEDNGQISRTVLKK